MRRLLLVPVEELRAEFERVKGALAEAEPVPAAGPRRVVARRESGVPVEVLGTDHRRDHAGLRGPGGGDLTVKQVVVKLGWDPAVAVRVEGARSWRIASIICRWR